ncbi:MAG TPA: hypothetical protein VHS31_00855 [Tepidisphaeraceae bacterium]|jgi:hypothetical protein|nr:hypothetical protein [Tepidisphaeraceae bacterium]
MQETLTNLFFLFSRYVHIVATTLIVGGTLFFEMVVPVAIGELKTEVQLALMGRMRWIFRWVVYTCAITLIITGAISAYRNYDVVNGQFLEFLSQNSSPQKIQALQDESIFNRPRIWFVAHLASGVLSLMIAIWLVHGGSPSDRQLQWMRLNLFVLMIAIFVASASRGARQNLWHPVMTGHATDPSVHE